jgi:hypothetical protein
VLWLRAISNVKVKLRHAMMPTSELEPWGHEYALVLVNERSYGSHGPFTDDLPLYLITKKKQMIFDSLVLPECKRPVY